MTSQITDIASAVRLDRPEFYDGDYEQIFERLRDESPVFWQADPGFWVISRHADVRAIAADPVLYSSWYGFTVGAHAGAVQLDNDEASGGCPVGRLVPPIDAGAKCPMPDIAWLRRDVMRRSSSSPDSETMQSLDPPDHFKVRQIFSKGFTPKVLDSLTDWVRQLTTDALDQIENGQTIDLVETLAVAVPIYVIAELLGVSKQDRADFKRWSDVVIKAVEPTDAAQRADDARQLAELFEYFREQFAIRRAHPRDDLLTKMVEAEVDGRPLQDATIETLAKQLLSAGNETSRSAISGTARAIAQFPEQRARLIEAPELIGGAVDEFLRWVTPVRAFCRTATRDHDFGGQAIRRGDFLVLSYPSANRDERAWERPKELDVTRRPQPMHLTFSHGPHVCLGQSLARLELRVVVEELLKRFPAYELAGDVSMTSSTMVNAIQRMPVRFR